jgi:hypothetical protein
MTHNEDMIGSNNCFRTKSSYNKIYDTHLSNAHALPNLACTMNFEMQLTIGLDVVATALACLTTTIT